MRRAFLPLLLTSLSLLACPPSGIGAVERRQGVNGDFVVADERKIYFCPQAKLDASCAYAFPAETNDTSIPLSHNLATFKLLGEEGAFAYVESLPTSSNSDCYGGWAPIDGTRLRGYIPKSAIVPVVHDRVDRTYADGTRITLLPGVAIFPQATPNSFLAPLAGFDVLVDVPKESVSSVFPGEPLPKPGAVISSITVTTPTLAIPPSTVVASASASATASAAPAQPPRPAAELPTPMPFAVAGKPIFAEPHRNLAGKLEPTSLPLVEQRFLVDGTPGAVTHLRCAELLGKVQNASVGGPLPVAGPRPSEKGAAFVGAGEKISWPNGTVAGATTSEIAVSDEVTVDARGDVRCFRRPLHSQDPRLVPWPLTLRNSLMMCFPRTSIRVP